MAWVPSTPTTIGVSQKAAQPLTTNTITIVVAPTGGTWVAAPKPLAVNQQIFGYPLG